MRATALKHHLLRHTRIYTVALMFVLAIFSQVVSTMAMETNLVANPSVETAGSSTSAPASWSQGGWGTNSTAYTWQTTGKDGSRSLSVKVNSYTNGDAKWMSAPITVKPSTTYTISDWYQATTTTSLELSYTTTSGATKYVWLADTAANTAWQQASASFTTPADIKNMTIYHVLAKVGTLQTDAYSVVDASATAPAPTAPTVSISAPANGATISGTQTITAAASDAVSVSGVQFKVDDIASGSEVPTAPYTISLDTTKLANGTHSISAIARNPSGLTSTASISVTVNNTATPTPTPTPTPTSANLIANPSVETAANTTTPQSWSADSWGTNKATFNYLTTGHTGSRSLKTTLSSYKNGDAKWHFANVPVTPGKTYQYTNWYQGTVDSEIDAEVTMNDGSVQYFYLTTAPTSSAWAKVSGQITIPANAKSITVYQVLAKNGSVTTDDFSFAEYTPVGFNRAMVSLTFDDGWRSQYTNALPLLDKYGVKATFYLLTSTTDYPDYMTVAQMQALKDHGNQIASHTVTHPHLPTLTVAKIDQELANSQSQLRTWFGSDVAKDFATPYGEYNGTVINEIKKYYRSHRSTDEGFNSKDNFDIYNIKVQNILNTTPASQVAAWIAQAQRDHTWLVLVYHEIATAVEDPTYSISPADLDAQLTAIKNSGITVETVDQAIGEIQAQ
jgi:peptidoglycan/xylan/chitin deacetylase (PgdA/CDA1 family)